MRIHLSLAAAVLACALAGAPTGTRADSLYVSDEFANFVERFKVGGQSPTTLIPGGTTSGLFGPNAVLVPPSHEQELVVANQNVNLPTNGDIRIFSRSTGALIKVLVPGTSVDAPFAPFGMVIYKNVLFVMDEGGGLQGNPTGAVRAYRFRTGAFIGTLSTAGYAQSPLSPFGAVIGPDGKLYVSNRYVDIGATERADILRFDPDTMKFLSIFVNGETCGCDLYRAGGLVFGPDGRLYVTSLSSNLQADTDKILIFHGRSGAYVDHIDLDRVGKPRTASIGILFGPGGELYATIAGVDASGNPTNVGSVRRYDVATKTFQILVPPKSGILQLPSLFTFGLTDPATLAYND